MYRKSSGVSRLFALSLLAGLASVADAQTDVPLGGAVIELGAGSGQIVIEVKNKTGKDAYDISVSIFRDDGGEVPDITGQDIVENDGQAEPHDHVDDDGNGKLDPGEGDSIDGSKGAACKSIMETGKDPVKNGKVAKVAVTFDAPLPEGAKIRVKFSERIGDIHHDMCLAWPLGDDGFTVALVETGPAQMSYEVLNLASAPLDHLSIPTHLTPVPLVGAMLDGPFSNRIIVIDDDSVEIYDIGLPPGGAMTLGLTFSKPVEFVFEQGQVPMFGVFRGCRADVNRDGVVDARDFLEYLNLFTGGDPRADWNGDGLIDVIDFLAFLNDWSACL